MSSNDLSSADVFSRRLALGQRLVDAVAWRLVDRSHYVASHWSGRYHAAKMRCSSNQWIARAAQLRGELMYEQAEFLLRTITNGPTGDVALVGSAWDRQALVLAGALADRGRQERLWCFACPSQAGTQKRPKHWPALLDDCHNIEPGLSNEWIQKQGLTFSLVLIDATQAGVVAQRDAEIAKDHLAPGGMMMFKDRMPILPRVLVGAHNALGCDQRFARSSTGPVNTLIYLCKNEQELRQVA
jgi:hypothetical protein